MPSFIYAFIKTSITLVRPETQKPFLTGKQKANCLRIYCIIFCIFLFCNRAKADHLVGGELFYEYIGNGSNNVPRYKVTLRFYRNMEANVPVIKLETPVLAINNSSGSLLRSVYLAYDKVDTMRNSKFPACVNASLQSIYEIGYFSATIELADVAGGYILSWIRCCRSNNVTNMALVDKGITLTSVVPGSDLIGKNFNNSAVFPLKDTVLICNNQFFAVDFGATDVDSDSLSYQFSPAYHGASLFDPNPSPDSKIKYESLTYRVPSYTYDKPLGVGVTINPVTGMISGTPAATGNFIISVKVTEWRNGKAINEHWKDIRVKVKDCTYAVASLKPDITNCNDFKVSFKNDGQSSGNKTYTWDFGVAAMLSDTSNVAEPVYEYADTGTYKVKLVVNKNTTCADSAFTTVKVYPGYKAAFSAAPGCTDSLIHFKDSSGAGYANAQKWLWNFDDVLSADNTSTLAGPSHTYTTAGKKNIRLISASDKGCADTTTGIIEVFATPALNIITADTSICKGDSIAVMAHGSGSVTWSPGNTIINTGSLNPIVYPPSTTTYIASITQNNCTNTDSIKISVLQREDVSITPTLTICYGDSIQLQPTSKATVYRWYPSNNLSDATIKSPVAFPASDITYVVSANAAGCSTSDSVHVTVHPLPRVSAGADIKIIATTTTVNLSGSGAQTYKWTPSLGLSNSNIANPDINLPLATDSVLYVLTGTSGFGCTNTDDVKVVVVKEPGAYVPTAFTPNGDGRNDTFSPTIFGRYELIEFTVFNRWGQPVFTTKKKGEGWTGDASSYKLQSDTYAWSIELKDQQGKITVTMGTVVLIR